MTRVPSCDSSASTVATSSLSILPTGMPVQPETTSPTICASTQTRISGDLALHALQVRRSAWPARRAALRDRAAVLAARRPCRGRAGAGAAVAAAWPPGALRFQLARAPRECGSPDRAPFPSARCNSASRASAAAFCLAIAASRSRDRRPGRLRARARAVCTAQSSISRVASSMAGGMAFWPSARRAQAVSSTLTALSGSWRSGR